MESPYPHLSLEKRRKITHGREAKARCGVDCGEFRSAEVRAATDARLPSRNN